MGPEEKPPTPTRQHELTEPPGSAYRLLLRLASGGMASVYVGVRRDDPKRELVAIKRTHPHLLDNPSFAKALAAEANLLARMHHPNVVAIRELEQRGGELLLVMDYVEGPSLSGLMRGAHRHDTPIPVPIAVRIVLDACAGLAEAHELENADGTLAGLVHRDVSPQNILLHVDGTAKVADFGIAKLASSDATATDTGILKGKVSYMAPEYIELGVQDARGDLFALGIVLWEALVGTRPFEAANEVAVLRRIAAETADPPSKHAPALGTVFDDVLARALARSVETRFRTARTFGAALEETAAAAGLLATHADVAEWLDVLAGKEIAERRNAVTAVLTENGALRDAPHAQENVLKSETVVVDFTVAMPVEVKPRRGRRAWMGASAALLVLVAAAASWVRFTRPIAATTPVTAIANSAENKPLPASEAIAASPSTALTASSASAPSPAEVASTHAPAHRVSHTKPAATSHIHAPPNPYSKPPKD
ncbi:MAG: serine/threonine-protein kinase [Polyangiaceae bacterium]